MIFQFARGSGRDIRPTGPVQAVAGKTQNLVNQEQADFEADICVTNKWHYQYPDGHGIGPVRIHPCTRSHPENHVNACI